MKENNIFISFLGTSPYLETVYESDGNKYQTRFIQEALIKKLCTDWDKNSRIVIFYTDGENGSYKKNWLDNGQPRESNWIGLQHVINDLKETGKLKAKVEHDFIPEGFNEDEVEKMFEKVYSYIEPDDNIYLDITHAFRTIPMFASALLDYSHFMKHTSTIGVYYGAFEKLGPAFEVSKIPIEERIAPIVDMMGIVKLQQYTRLGANLKEMGRTNGIGINLKEGNDNKPLMKVACKIDELDKNIIVNRSEELAKGEFLKSVQEARRTFRNLKISAPIRNIFNELLALTSEFTIGNSNRNIEASIRWAHKYKMLPQAYTMGQEYVISLAMEKLTNICPYSDKNKNRQFVGQLIGLRKYTSENESYYGYLAGYGNLVRFAYQHEWVEQLNKVYSNLTKKRIEIDHAKGSEKFENLDEEFSALFETSISIIKEAKVIEKYPIKQNRIFINLSNHSSTNWSEKQLLAAKEYGEIIDIAFPQIPEDADEEYIKKTVDHYTLQISQYASDAEITVHVMGEMTFTYSIVKKLTDAGYRCVASTTRRIKEELPDGSFKSSFEFCKFREYKL